VENDTPRGMASSFHTHSRGNTIKLVHKLGIEQRNCDLDDIAIEFYSHFSFKHENPNIDATLKQIRGMIFIKEPEVKLITEEQQ
jgi:hypothetical protein